MTIAEELNLINSIESYNVKLVIDGFDYQSVNAYLTVLEENATKFDIMRCDYIRMRLKQNAKLFIKSKLRYIKNFN